MGFSAHCFFAGAFGTEGYEMYVERKFEEQLFEYTDIQAWLDEGDYSFGDEMEQIEMTTRWLREFYEQIPSERTRKQYMKKYMWEME